MHGHDMCMCAVGSVPALLRPSPPHFDFEMGGELGGTALASLSRLA